MKPVNYISNKKLYESIIEYKKLLDDSVKNGIDKPMIPNYIGECITLICNNLAKKINFARYTYIQDMISDGIIDCISAVDNFDPEKTNNPFAYFTQIAWNAFIRRIQKEKKQTYIKHKNFENMIISNENWDDIENIQLKYNEHSSEIIRSFEESIDKSKKTNKVGIEKIMEDNNE